MKPTKPSLTIYKGTTFSYRGVLTNEDGSNFSFMAGTPVSSGTLVIGQRYVIYSYVSDDRFDNLGAAANASGVVFVATGTTPTHWVHASVLVPVYWIRIGARIGYDTDLVITTEGVDANITASVDVTNSILSWEMTPAQTGALDFSTAIFQVEMYIQEVVGLALADVDVHRLIDGYVTLKLETIYT